MGRFLDVILDLEADLLSETILFVLYLPIWASRAHFETNMEFGAKEGSNFDDFCQERIA